MSSLSTERQADVRSTRSMNWFNLLSDIFRTYYIGKELFYSILQVQYIRLQHKLNSTEAHDARIHLASQIADFSCFMGSCGLLLRETGFAALLDYAGGFTAHLIFIVATIIPSSPFVECYRNDCLILLYTNPELSEEQFQSAADSYLEQMTILNRKKLRALARFDYLSLISPVESEKIVRDLTEQQSQLRDLLSDKAAIRPRNRCEKWKQEQTKFVLRSTLSMIALTYLLFTGTATYGGIYSMDLMSRRGEKANLLEILSVQEINIAVIIFAETVLSPLIILIFNLKDRRMTLKTIKQQIRRLMEKLAELPSSRAEKDTSVDRIRADCSRKSLEIYLSLRIFLDELRSSAKLASTISTQYALFGLTFIFTILVLFPRSSPVEFRIAAFLTAFPAAMIDFSFLVCADLESNCSKVVQLAWSLVAHTTIGNQDSEAVKPFEVERAIELKRFGRTVSRREQQSEIYMFDHLGVSSINGQTALLWRRFVADMQKVHDNFRFTALGLFELNFRGVLRLNFWFVSMLLLALIYLS